MLETQMCTSLYSDTNIQKKLQLTRGKEKKVKKAIANGLRYCFLYDCMKVELEFGCIRCTWERYHITDILHTGDKQDQSFET